MSCAVAWLEFVHDNADRGGEDDLLGADLHRRAERAPDPLGQRRHVMRVGLRNQQDGELVAAEARQRVLRIEVAAEPSAERQQHAVADDQAEALVHVLEAVDVDEQHGGPVGLAFAGAGDGALEAIHEQLAVGQARQAVMHRIVDQPFIASASNW